MSILVRKKNVKLASLWWSSSAKLALNRRLGRIFFPPAAWQNPRRLSRNFFPDSGRRLIRRLTGIRHRQTDHMQSQPRSALASRG